MGQTARDIIARVAQEVGDEFYHIIKKESLLKDLDRVYRKYCEETQILSSSAGIVLSDSNEYPLQGITETQKPFGEALFELYRAEYNNKEAFEIDWEDVMNIRLAGSQTRDSSNINFAIKYYKKAKRLYFPFTPSLNDTFIFWYYEIPPIGTVRNLDSGFDIDDKNVDDLVLGLKISARTAMINYHRDNNQGTQLKFHSLERYDDMINWKALLKDQRNKTKRFKVTTTPLAVQLPGGLNNPTDDSTIL